MSDLLVSLLVGLFPIVFVLSATNPRLFAKLVCLPDYRCVCAHCVRVDEGRVRRAAAT
ncbi:hypothetical protein F5883DRAFT_656773 [Diaporthe sp. PMI_573]|nr:hypothetical protein F5883DRAFT_656773 [Diaporthaceae sp. PMI_573]